MRNSNQFSDSFANLVDSIKENLLSFIIAFVLFVYVSSLAWQYFTMEKVIETRYTLTDRAKLNGYYASELLLNELSDEMSDDEVATSQLDMDLLTLIDELPYLTTTDDFETDIDTADTDTANKNASNEYTGGQRHPTLIINNIGSSLNDDKLEELTQWIEQGGHLITFTSSDVIDTDDWEEVEQQLQSLKGMESTAEQVNNDVTLQDLLTEINKDSSNTLLNYLGIYRTRKAQTGEYEDIDIEETSDYKALSAELDRLGFSDTSEKDTTNNGIPPKNKVSNKKAINNNQVRQHIVSLYTSDAINIISTNSQGSEPIAMSDSSRSSLHHSQLNADVLLASIENVKLNHQFYPINIDGIRHYLQQQLQQVTALQESQSNELVKKGNYKQSKAISKLATQAKAIETLLKLSDEQLHKIFRTKDALSDTLVDINLGKGRLTVLDNVDIWSNPTASTLRSIHQSQAIHSDYHVPLFNKRYDGLYGNDHAKLLVTLTKDSHEIWLFPNVDIDSLPIMLWKKSRLAVLGLALLTFMWVWSLYDRFGKRQYILNSNESDIFRYFRQIGRYGWDFDNGKRLTKVTRIQAVKFAKKALLLKQNNSLTANHLPKLNQVLQVKLTEKLANHASNFSNANDNNHRLNSRRDNQLESQFMDMLQTNQQHIEYLIDIEQLKDALLPTANDLDSFTAHGFTEYSQTLWLIKWLLK